MHDIYIFPHFKIKFQPVANVMANGCLLVGKMQRESVSPGNCRYNGEDADIRKLPDIL